MLNLEQSTTAEPHGDALFRLAELGAAIHAAAERLTLADARAISCELDAVARMLRRRSYPKPRWSPKTAVVMTATQGDLLG